MKVFAKRMRELRESPGVNQTEVANRAGISRQSVTLYERGARVPDIKTLRNLAVVFGVTSDYLIGLSDIPDRTTKLPDELARITEKQRETLRHCDDVIIISKRELAESVVKALFE